jgi:hypothetical protein
MAAMAALILMSAKDGRSAYLDGAHDPQMIARQLMGFSIDRPVLAEDLRHFKATRCSHPISGLRRLLCFSIERTCDLGQIQAADMQVDGCCRGRSVTKKQLDMVETCSCFKSDGWQNYASAYARWPVW